MTRALSLLGWLARLGLAGLLFWGLRAAALGSPAMNAELRAVGVAQDWRVPLSTALFDAPLYHYQLGFAEIFAERFLPGDAPSTDDERTARAERAIRFFDAALREAPADAYAWTGRAWAALYRDAPADAALALTRSLDLAPFNLELSPERVFVAEALADILGSDATFSDVGLDLKALCSDMAFASTSRLYRAEELAAFTPYLTARCAPYRGQ